MELYLESVNPYPEINQRGSDIAYRRVDSMLRALGLQHAAMRGIHTHRIITASIVIWRNTGQPLEAIAAEMTLSEIKSGLHILTQQLTVLRKQLTHETLLLTLRKTDIPNQYPEVVLGHTAPNEQILSQLMTEFQTQNMPMVQRMSMGASTLRFETMEEVTSHTAAFFHKVPILFKLLFFGSIVAFYYVIYLFAK